MGWGEPQCVGTTSEVDAAHRLLDAAGIPPGTLAVTLYRPMRGRWTFGVGVDVDLDPAESQVSLTLAFWRLVVWWSRP